jgi:hypothetical protein
MADRAAAAIAIEVFFMIPPLALLLLVNLRFIKSKAILCPQMAHRPSTEMMTAL